MSKKYELTSETQTLNGKTLYRIKALRDFGNIRAGNLGGFIGDERNLSQENSCWVSASARVLGSAQVFGSAWVSDSARVLGNAQVSGDAQVFGNARVFGNAQVSGDAQVFGSAWVSDKARVLGNAQVFGSTWVSGNAQVFGSAWVSGSAQVYDAWVSDSARVLGDARVSDSARVLGDARVSEKSHVITFSGFGSSARTTTAFKTELSFSISCGCFSGTLEEFRAAISKTHGDNKFGREYKLVADLIELHFSEE